MNVFDPIIRGKRRLLGVLFVGLLMGTAPLPAVGQAPTDTADTDSTRRQPVVPYQPAPPEPIGTGPAAASDTSEPERAIVTADSLSALTRDGRRVQELFDNVRVRQDTTRLRSEYGLRYLNRDELLFTGDVVIYERGDTLRADTVRYNKQTKVGRAWSNVRLTDGEVVVRAPRAIYYTEEKRSVFPDSVTLVDSSRVLRAQSGTYWSNQSRADFQGNVRLTDPETYLEADSLTYYRDQERSIATGRVFIRRQGKNEQAPRDTTSRTYLFGNWADNQEQNQYSRVEGQALLVRVRMDSTGAPEDTLIVQGHRLEAFRTDTHRRLIAVDSVRIWQEDLSAVADSAVYDRVISTGAVDSTQRPSPLPDSAEAPRPDTTARVVASADSLSGRRDPPVEPAPDSLSTTGPDSTTTAVASTDSARVPVDSAQTASTDTTDLARAQGGAPADSAGAVDDSTVTRSSGGGWDRPTAQTEDDLPLEESRLFRSPVTWFERSQVWGDSIRVRTHDRTIDTVFVRGSAFAAQQDTTIDKIQQLKGRRITAFFRRDSLRRILARPNAQAIRFLASEDGSLKGGAKASGDRIVLHFRDGTVKRTSVIGGVKSTYHRTPESIPDPFHLQGFQWTPDRKPTKTGLLQEQRVRERLDLDAQRQPPLAQRARGRTAPDSGRGERRRQAPVSRKGTVPTTLPGGRRPSPPPDSIAVPVDSIQGRRPGSPTVPSDTNQTSKSQP